MHLVDKQQFITKEDKFLGLPICFHEHQIHSEINRVYSEGICLSEEQILSFWNRSLFR